MLLYCLCVLFLMHYCFYYSLVNKDFHNHYCAEMSVVLYVACEVSLTASSESRI